MFELDAERMDESIHEIRDAHRGGELYKLRVGENTTEPFDDAGIDRRAVGELLSESQDQPLSIVVGGAVFKVVQPAQLGLIQTDGLAGLFVIREIVVAPVRRTGHHEGELADFGIQRPSLKRLVDSNDHLENPHMVRHGLVNTGDVTEPLLNAVQGAPNLWFGVIQIDEPDPCHGGLLMRHAGYLFSAISAAPPSPKFTVQGVDGRDILRPDVDASQGGTV